MTLSTRLVKASRIFYILTYLLNMARSDMSPNPNPYFVTDVIGLSQGPIYLRGSLGFSWEEDEEGFTIIPTENRTYFYAILDITTGNLVRTILPIRKIVNGVLSGLSPLSLGLIPHLQPADIVKALKCGDFCNRQWRRDRETRSLVSTTGTLKKLMVLFKFSDHTTRTLPSVDDITTLLNHAGNGVNVTYSPLAPTGSLREHYLKSSYGKLQINSYVTNWVTIDFTESYCSGGTSGKTVLYTTCLSNALSKIDSQVNFTQFDVNGDKWIDAIGFLHSGYGAEFSDYDAYGTYYTNRIWSHKFQLSSPWTSAEGVKVSNYYITPAVWGTRGSTIVRIGVIAHETGHYLGLPDLYDTDGNGSGIGLWSLMADSWGFPKDQFYPPPMDAWCKMKLGWVTPIVISPSQTPISLAPQCQSSTIYKITTNFPSGEYLLIENRQKVCLYDSQMGGTYSGGLAIYHIDENQPSYDQQGYPGQSGWPSNGNHYKISIIQADSSYALEKGVNRGFYKNLFHAGNILGVSNSSAGPYPNSDSYAVGRGLNKTGIRISDIAESGNNISFLFTLNYSSDYRTSSAATSRRIASRTYLYSYLFFMHIVVLSYFT